MLRGSESNLWGSELEANYASSCEEILSSKDSLNFIPSVKVTFQFIWELFKKKLYCCIFTFHSDHSRSQMNHNNTTTRVVLRNLHLTLLVCANAQDDNCLKIGLNMCIIQLGNLFILISRIGPRVETTQENRNQSHHTSEFFFLLELFLDLIHKLT
jgi:hypothetical protein